MQRRSPRQIGIQARIIGGMLRAEEVFAWVALSRAPALDARLLSKALGILGDAHGIINASDGALLRAGIPPLAREYLSSAACGVRAAERAWLLHPAHQLVPFTDPRYPALLRELAGCPIALYVAGNVGVLNDPQLAIVGSRNPSPAGREIAFEFAESLAACGLGISSGLAAGIDSAAHHGALKAQGVTVAVLGSGVDVIYPRINRTLSERILEQGAVISELPLGTPPRRENFPRRNRIIATLSLGTLVVEAARRSGSLITARLAADHDRELFAVPGSIRNPLSRGCHDLIRHGAKLAESAADILSELNFSAFFARSRLEAPAAESASNSEAGMDKEHKILLDALGFDPADLDVLVDRTGFKPEAVSSMMLILELEGHVQAAPGGRYSRVVRSRR
ncbi:MAG TPA: DNA-processing protein DprA [Steroidobacteraceae bacterium]|nr:DNA-processing protein DprA [Steroidobacteraceae bacterium]